MNAPHALPPALRAPACRFAGRAAVIQSILTPFRRPLFEQLERACEGGLSVYSGQPRRAWSAATADALDVRHWRRGHNRYLFRGRFEAIWQEGLIDWLHDWEPDVLITDANPRLLRTPAVLRWMQRRNRPVLGWGLGLMPLSPGLHRARAFLRDRALRRFDGLLAYSSHAAAQYAGIGVRRVFVARNAVSPAPAGASPVRALRPQDRPTVICVGRLLEGKRVDVLLRAAATLPEAVRPRLLIVGDGALRCDLEALARTVYPAAQFTGELRGEAMAAAFASADLFVLPGLGGLAVQEAMSHALPVIVADGDGTQEDLVRPDSGWRVPPGDTDALARTLATALADLPRLRCMGEAAFRIVRDEVNLDTLVAAIVGALNAVTAAAGSAACK